MKRTQSAGVNFVLAKETKNLWAREPNTEILDGYLEITPQGIGEDLAQVKRY